MPNVFAYGTLMFPEVAVPVAQIDAAGEPLTIHSYRRYEARTRDWGNYPAIVPEAGATVDGLLFRDLTERQLEQLDWFEDVADGLYVRKQIEMDIRGDRIKIHLYVCGPMLERRLLHPLNTAWNPELFRRNELSRFVERVVDPAVKSATYCSRFQK